MSWLGNEIKGVFEIQDGNRRKKGRAKERGKEDQRLKRVFSEGINKARKETEN